MILYTGAPVKDTQETDNTDCSRAKLGVWETGMGGDPLWYFTPFVFCATQHTHQKIKFNDLKANNKMKKKTFNHICLQFQGNQATTAKNPVYWVTPRLLPGL